MDSLFPESCVSSVQLHFNVLFSLNGLGLTFVTRTYACDFLIVTRALFGNTFGTHIRNWQVRFVE